MKQNLIRTIDLIGRALHPDHLKTNDFIFSKRGDLLNHLLVSNGSCIAILFLCMCSVCLTCTCIYTYFIQNYIHCEPVAFPITTETRTLAISALATLVYPLDSTICIQQVACTCVGTVDINMACLITRFCAGATYRFLLWL